MLMLLRYWLIPARIARLPRAALLFVAAGYLGMLSYFPRTVAGQYRFEFEPSEFRSFLSIINVWISPAICVYGMMAGAMAVAQERQRGTWEALHLTRLSMSQILGGKLATVWLRGCIAALPAVVFLVRAVLLEPPYPSNIPSYHTTAQYFGWWMVELALKLLTFALLGMAISAWCKRVQTALCVSGGLIAAYCALHQLSERLAFCSMNGYDEHLHGHLFYWPLFPPGEQTESVWQHRLIADGIWGVALPCLCWIVILLACRVKDRA